MNGNHLTTLSLWSQRSGLDYDQEQKNLAEHRHGN
jgi:hypothetical protein